MMHDEFHPFRSRVVPKSGQVEIRIWSHEVENPLFHVAEPVFPSDVPSFHQHAVETVLGREIYVFPYIFSGGPMPAVRLHLRQVVSVDMHAAEVVGVGPRAFARNHFPPDSDILVRTDPRSVVYLARLVEVQSDSGSQDIPRIVGHDDSPPRRSARRLHIGHVPVRVRRQMGFEHQLLVVKLEMHGRVVHQSGLMQVYIDAVICLHLQGSLDSGR